MASKKEVTQIMAVLVAAYPNAKLIPSAQGAPGTIEVYCTMLANVPPDELLAAVKYCILNHPDFFPSIATIHEAIRKMHPSHTVSGADAWGVVLKAIRDVGYIGKPEFDDPAIARAVEAFGWRNICMSDEQDFAIRAQFIKAYETYAQRVREENEMLQIPEACKVMAEIATRHSVKALEAKHENR